MNEEEINKLWKAVDTENESDCFLVGSGNEELASNYSSPESFSDQIISESEELDIPLVNDLSKFETEKIKLNDKESYIKLFTRGKKEAYNIFKYLDIKSSNIMGFVNEEDLILDDSDFYLIDELLKINDDYFAVYNLSKLYTYLEMGINEVRFKQKDNCPICKTMNGNIFDVNKVINLVGSNNGVSHKYCDCDFTPVIRREGTYGVLDEFLNIDLEINDKSVVSAPVEVKDEVQELVCQLPNSIIEFLNIGQYLYDNNIDNSDSVVAVENEEGILFVHNSYVENKGPTDFLEALLDEDNVVKRTDISNLKGRKELYYNGGKVVEFDGKYWDSKSGLEINIFK